MPFGLVLSFMCHAALLGWALFSMRSPHDMTPDTPAISVDLITPSEFLRLKQGSEDAKKLETKAKDEPKPDDNKNDTNKPADAAAPPPPPPQPPQEDVAKAEPPPEPEPPKAAEPPPPKPPEPDPIAKQIDQPPPPPEPAPGPTPDEKKALDQKLEEQRQADEAKKKEEEKKKAEEALKKKLEDEKRKKKLAEEKKKKQEEAKKKAEAAKKKFDASKIASLLDKSPDDAPPKALIDKDPRKKGQQASGSSATSTDTGKSAGTTTGTDTVLSAREQDLLKGMLKSQLNGCWRPPGTGGGSDVPVVELHWEMNPDGSLSGEPRVTSAPSTTAGQVYSEAALRAVRMCSPFHLPPDKYEGGWKTIDWTFDPREML